MAQEEFLKAQEEFPKARDEPRKATTELTKARHAMAALLTAQCQWSDRFHTISLARSEIRPTLAA